MAWVYGDWRSQGTSAARLARLRLHLQEVGDALLSRATSVTADGKSMTREQLQTYYDRLDEREQSLAAAGSAGGGRSYVRLARPRGE